jgi:hypothetical protein
MSDGSIIYILLNNYLKFMNEKPKFSSPENYEKIFTKEQKAGHLSLEEAQDTANMMRSKIGVEPWRTGKVFSKEKDKKERRHDIETTDDLREWRKINTDVTKRDYEEALKKVEMIEKLANEETSEEEFNFKLKKIAQVGGQVLAASILVPLGIITFNIKEMDGGLKRFKENREKLIDAKTILKKLIEEGDEFGQNEKSYNKKETI